jgi:tetrahydromethanopterin S-methyltransferase subunit G
MKIQKLVFLMFTFCFGAAVLLAALPTLAVDGETPWEKIKTPLGELGEKSGFVEAEEAVPKSPAEIAAGIINAFLTLLGIIAVILIVYGGFLWMTAGGNEERITKAKKILYNAAIGLIIIIMAYSITYFLIQRITQAAQ